MSRKKFTTRVNLNETERENLLNRLDQQSRADRAPIAATTSNRRRYKRWNFREPNIAVSVEHPAGGISRLFVCTRNLSAGGMSFVHGGYLHKGSTCQAVLRANDGQMHSISGTIVSCHHVEGLLHQIGLKFDRRIDPTHFVEEPKVEPQPTDTMAVQALRGNLLYIDDSIDDRNLMKFVLDICEADLCTAPSGIEGLAMLDQKRFDVVMTELWLPGISGFEVIGALREGGFSGPIVAMSADETPETRKQAMAKGCTEMLIKPLDFEHLMALLGQFMGGSAETSQALIPLFSTRWSDVRIRPLILEFLTRLQSQVRQLQQYLDASDQQSVQKLCLAVKGSAGGYGFPELSTAAEALRQHVATAKNGAMNAKPQFQRLAQLCAAACLVRDEDEES